jgi:uncharacterized cupredoxin-like copper-binding protein
MRVAPLHRRLPVRAELIAPLVVLTVAGLAACGSRSHGSQAGSGGRKVEVTLENFKIDMPAQIRAGRVTLMVAGAGPTMHELNVARSDAAPDALPVGADHLVDDHEPHVGFTHVAEAEGIDLGQRKTMTLSLSPGHYVLYCNMDGHYRAGMSTALTVVP